MYPIEKKDSWPVRLALRLGAKDKQQASKVVLATSILLIIIAIVIYTQSASGPGIEKIDPVLMMEMEALNRR